MKIKNAHLMYGIMALVLLAALGLGTGVAYAADGDLDYSFGGGDGLVTTNFRDTSDEVRAMAVQPDGKIVVVGRTHISGTKYVFSVARYNTDGSPDSSFGGGSGKATTSFTNTTDDEAYAVAIQPTDGKIVVAGTTCGWAPGDCLVAVARFNPDGSLDPTFGAFAVGRAIYSCVYRAPSAALSVAIQGDGKIVLGGYSGTGTSGDVRFCLARRNADGTADNSFGGGGIVMTYFFGGHDGVNAIAIQPGGRILAAGSVQVNGSDHDFGLARYNSDGSLDATFGLNGKVTTDFFGGGDDGAYAMALQPDGKIVLAGHSWNVSGGYDFGLARYLPNGDLDTGFDIDGKQVVGFANGVNTEVALGVALQTDGKIVAAGYAPIDGINDFALSRLAPDGALDYEFGGGDGRVNNDFGGGVAIANAVVIQSDGRIVAAGNAYMGEPHSYDFAVARYLSGGASNPTPTPTAQATPTTCPVQFTDVPPGSTFYDYVRCLACRGIISGYPDGTFLPGNNVTRGQLSKIVSNAAGFIEPHNTQSFQDVPVGSTLYDFVQRLSSRGIISGYACGGAGEPCVGPDNLPYFRPGASVTRGQTAKIVASAAGLPAPPPGLWTFQDVPQGSTFWQWVESLASSGAITGYPCGGDGEPCMPPENRYYFRPSNNVTRGQSAKIVAYTFFPGCQTPGSASK